MNRAVGLLTATDSGRSDANCATELVMIKHAHERPDPQAPRQVSTPPRVLQHAIERANRSGSLASGRFQRAPGAPKP
jgi:hypothetical protein